MEICIPLYHTNKNKFQNNKDNNNNKNNDNMSSEHKVYKFLHGDRQQLPLRPLSFVFLHPSIKEKRREQVTETRKLDHGTESKRIEDL